MVLKLSRRGSVIVLDSVIRKRAIIDAESNDRAAIGMRRLVEMLARQPRVTVTVIQTFESKGYDGFALAVVSDTHARSRGK